MAKKTTKETQVVLYVEGGCIQTVHTNGPVNVTIIDKDELVEAGLFFKEREALYKKTIKGLKPAKNWGFVEVPNQED